MEELEGAELDLAVAKARGIAVVEGVSITSNRREKIISIDDDDCERYSPSTNWSQGGPIIEEYKICLAYVETKKGIKWYANTDLDSEYVGPTPLIAAMRALVASKEKDNG